MKDRLKHMKETLMSAVEMELCNLDDADAKELGEVVDMIKDIEETLYYYSIVEAMEEGGEEKERHKQWKEKDEHMMYYPMMYNERNENTDERDNSHRSYYNGNISSSGMYNNSSRSMYTEREMPMDMFADGREGRSPRSRRMYMEAKESHQDKTVQIRELEKYMQELSQDMIEMVEDATPEEKQLLSKRISALATKISQLDD